MRVPIKRIKIYSQDGEYTEIAWHESKRSSPLLSADAPFRRLGSSRSGTDAPARLPLSFTPQERLSAFLYAALPGSQRDSPWPTHATAQGSRIKDTRPHCDGILRQLRCLRMARCLAGRLAAAAAHRAGVGWRGNDA